MISIELKGHCQVEVIIQYDGDFIFNVRELLTFYTDFNDKSIITCEIYATDSAVCGCPVPDITLELIFVHICKK